MKAPKSPRRYSAAYVGGLLFFLVAPSCSVLNRQGPDVTCAVLDDGAVNACEEGIIATCFDGAVYYAACDDANACEASWQIPGAYRCSSGDLPYDPVTTPASNTSGIDSSASSPVSTSVSPNPNPVASTPEHSDDDGCDPSSEPCAVASTAGDAIEWFALDQESIYFADCSSVWSVPKTGGFPTVLSSAEGKCPFGPNSVVQDNSTLFFLRGTNLFSLSKTGGVSQQLSEATAMALASDSDHVYWMDFLDNTLKSLTKTGGTPQTLATVDVLSFRTLTEHGGYLYWVNSEGLARIATGGPLPAAASTLPLDTYPDDFFVADAGIYFTSSSEHSVGRVDAESGLVTTLATAELGLDAITSDNNAVYWLNNGDRSELRKLSVADGSLTTIASLRARGGSNGIATDETHVYWTQGSTLMRVVK